MAGNPFFQDLDPAAAPPPVTPYGGVGDPAGYSKVTPPGTSPAPAPYDISAPQDIAGITAATEAAGRLAGGQEGAATGAGHLYPPGPRQAEAAAMMEAAQGHPAGQGSLNVFSGFPDYENQDLRPSSDLNVPIQGEMGQYPAATSTLQPGIPQFTAGLGAGSNAGVPGVTPEHGSVGPSKGMDYPGTIQDGLQKYGTT